MLLSYTYQIRLFPYVMFLQALDMQSLYYTKNPRDSRQIQTYSYRSHRFITLWHLSGFHQVPTFLILTIKVLRIILRIGTFHLTPSYSEIKRFNLSLSFWKLCKTFCYMLSILIVVDQAFQFLKFWIPSYFPKF